MAGCLPRSLEVFQHQAPRGSPGGVMNVNRFSVGGDNQHVVVTSRPILEEEHQRLSGGEVMADGRNRAFDAPCDPPPLPNRALEHVLGDTARAAVDQRLELLDVGVAFTPIAEEHRGGGAATEGLGLGKKWNLKGGPAGVGSVSDVGEDQREKKRNDEQRDIGILPLSLPRARSTARPTAQ